MPIFSKKRRPARTKTNCPTSIRLTEEMAQAFYRREHDTVKSLMRKGARFTPEMLHIARLLGDAHLIRLCYQNGIR